MARTAIGLVMILAAAGCMSGAAGTPGEGTAPGGAGSTPSTVLANPLPLPAGETLVEVLDPSVVQPAIDAEEAVARARAAWGGTGVGTSPLVQLVRTSSRDPQSQLANFTGWIILSTDVPSQSTGGPHVQLPSPVVYEATYTWVYVTAEGDVLGMTQNSYEKPEDAPPLP